MSRHVVVHNHIAGRDAKEDYTTRLVNEAVRKITAHLARIKSRADRLSIEEVSLLQRTARSLEEIG